MDTIRIFMIGRGNVGKAFLCMLNRKMDYIRHIYNCNPQIVAIATNSLGCMVNESGIDIDKNVFETPIDSRTTIELLEQLDYDIMIELTPLNIRDGQPAIEHIKRALTREKNVITANKGPIAFAYRELSRLASEHHACFFFESTVMDGAPVYCLAKENLKGCQILEVEGILNSTTNLVLQELAKGYSFEEAVRIGQEKGIVEKDPALDLDGWDAAVKLTSLMNVLMDAQITPKEIVREGVSGITKAHLDTAKANNCAIKVVCRGWFENGRPYGEVRPKEIPCDHILTAVNGTALAVTLTTDLLGKITIVEQEFQPEIDQTAYGVLGDLLRILDRR